jgi:hypothetical protein
MLERPGLMGVTGQVRGEEGTFPILGTLYAVRDLVCIGRKDRKSTILYLERRKKRSGHPEGYLGRAVRNSAGGLRGVSEHSLVSAWERSNWREHSPGSRVRIGMRVLDSSWIHRWWAMMGPGT